MPGESSCALLGSKLAKAREQVDLFTWFHFAPLEPGPIQEFRSEVDRKKWSDIEKRRAAVRQRTGWTQIPFKLPSETFRRFVHLFIYADAQDVIQRAGLLIYRKFINDPKTTLFAADLAKSFISHANDREADPRVAELIQEITVRPIAESTIPVLGRQALPSLPTKPSLAYQVYRGKPGTAFLINRPGTASIGISGLLKPCLFLNLRTVARYSWFGRLIHRAR